MNWCYSTPRLFCNYCCQISACSLSFKNKIFDMQDQSHLFQIAWNLCSLLRLLLCTGLSACNCLFDSRNCLLHWYWAFTINWIGQKGPMQFIGSLGHYFTPAQQNNTRFFQENYTSPCSSASPSLLQAVVLGLEGALTVLRVERKRPRTGPSLRSISTRCPTSAAVPIEVPSSKNRLPITDAPCQDKKQLK